ncbi:MAG: hypothetical protein M1819_006087 [Sarea resinae]|nr:MAG: hypothetical protein M1819_006087 [Sarea resinae]
MPAMLDDPTAPVIYRTSGAPPYPDPLSGLPPEIVPRQVTLRDRVTTATLVPFSSPTQVPVSLLTYLCDQLNKEIEKGDTYPMISPLPLASFGPYWFQNFGAVMLLGDIESADEVMQMAREGRDWEKECLGSFYIKPNYPGRSSHVCNGGFLVTDASRNRGVGRLMGEGYIEWAPQLVSLFLSSSYDKILELTHLSFQGYTYSVFNLVYETNVASCRIWDALGFKRIGRVKGCGNLRSHPHQLIDAIIYGRDMGPEGEDFVSEERFDKIRFYLKHGKYPNGADRAEKSRLRSAATHYKLVPSENGDGSERLMLKDKEVVSDPQRQYEIARDVHVQQHGGINKTTATIAERYHWVRIKETVSLVIRNCTDCKELAKAPVVGRSEGLNPGVKRPNGGVISNGQGGVSAAGRILSLPTTSRQSFGADSPSSSGHGSPGHGGTPDMSPQQQTQAQMQEQMQEQMRQQIHQQIQQQQRQQQHQQQQQQHHHAPIANMQSLSDYTDMPLDPQIMEDVQHHLTNYQSAASAQAQLQQSQPYPQAPPPPPQSHSHSQSHQQQQQQQQQHPQPQQILPSQPQTLPSQPYKQPRRPNNSNTNSTGTNNTNINSQLLRHPHLQQQQQQQQQQQPHLLPRHPQPQSQRTDTDADTNADLPLPLSMSLDIDVDAPGDLDPDTADPVAQHPTAQHHSQHQHHTPTTDEDDDEDVHVVNDDGEDDTETMAFAATRAAAHAAQAAMLHLDPGTHAAGDADRRDGMGHGGDGGMEMGD